MGWRSGEVCPDAGTEAGPALASDADTEASAECAHESELMGPQGTVAPERKRPRKRQEPTAAQRALGLLVRREHSQRELTRKLTSRGVTPEDAQAAVEKLRSAGWQDDARFAENLVRSRAGTGHGPVRIRAELATHGLDRDAIVAAMEGFEGDWVEIAREVIRRRFGMAGMDDRVGQRKGAELLLRRGFSTEHVRAATRFDPDD